VVIDGVSNAYVYFFPITSNDACLD
jgi:hypothetical protein